MQSQMSTVVCALPLSTPLSSPADANQPEIRGPIPAYADRALLAELRLTPKPGLVDRRNSGAHRDMDVSTFLTSARKLLAEGGVLAPDGSKKMEAFDDALIARHLSPRGTADLLAVTWFLAQFATLHEGMDTQ